MKCILIQMNLPQECKSSFNYIKFYNSPIFFKSVEPNDSLNACPKKAILDKD